MAATIGPSPILPKLGHTALRRAHRRLTFVCIELGAVAADEASANKIDARETSSVFCYLCGPTPSGKLVPSEPSLLTAPIVWTPFAPTIGTDMITSNSPGTTLDA